jgi:hypothetical protein
LRAILSVELHPGELPPFERVSMDGAWPLIGAMRAPPQPQDAFEPSLCSACGCSGLSEAHYDGSLYVCVCVKFIP